MPAKTEAKTERRRRSKSPARRRSSRSRSRGRSRSPSRKAKQSPTPTRQSRQVKTPKSTPPRQVKTPSTPTRQSARIAQQVEIKENEVDTKPAKGEKEITKPLKKLKTTKYEFGGPVLVTMMMLTLPAFIVGLNMACSKKSCSVKQFPAFPRSLRAYVNWESAAVVVGWLVFQAILAVVPVGRNVQGVPLKSGKRLTYRCNGFLALVVTLSIYGSAAYFRTAVTTFAYTNFLQLTVSAILTSFVLSVYLFWRSRKASASQQNAGGNTGCLVYDFFCGRELNPRIGSLDLKFFCELRPGLIAWVLLNLSFISQSCMESKGHPSEALMLVAICQTLYVADALWFEDSILTTMDITHEGFGFMLAFGDLAWVPFLYTLQTRYILEYSITWSYPALAAFLLLNLVGYFIFRGSNSQKDRFRKNPHDPALAYLETIPTTTGKALLVSGWWGLCRHPNYLGDLIMAVAWTVPCGFGSVIPYFYPLYFLVLLIHRAMRDDILCRQKYGAAWDRYCQCVPYKIFPYIY